MIRLLLFPLRPVTRRVQAELAAMNADLDEAVRRWNHALDSARGDC